MGDPKLEIYSSHWHPGWGVVDPNDTHLKFNSSPMKTYLPKMKVVVQPSFFTGTSCSTSGGVNHGKIFRKSCCLVVFFFACKKTHPSRDETARLCLCPSLLTVELHCRTGLPDGPRRKRHLGIEKTPRIDVETGKASKDRWVEDENMKQYKRTVEVCHLLLFWCITCSLDFSAGGGEVTHEMSLLI